jgi:hypothetical protein
VSVRKSDVLHVLHLPQGGRLGKTPGLRERGRGRDAHRQSLVAPRAHRLFSAKFGFVVGRTARGDLEKWWGDLGFGDPGAA